MVLFLLLFFGIGYGREFVRRLDIPNWPIVSARVEKTAVAPGPPSEIPWAPSVVPVRVLFPYHCRANYVFLVDGMLYQGTFVLLAKTAGQAQGLANGLSDRCIQVKYNPRKPKDSVLEERELLGTRVFQHGWNPINPKVW